MASFTRYNSLPNRAGKKDMDYILWPKNQKTKSIVTIKDSVTRRKDLSRPSARRPLALAASGDACSRATVCCRLCGNDHPLRYIDSTYQCDGVEERYDNVIYECFGVEVTPADCMICESCIVHLRNTQRFKALVHAAFGKQDSECSLINQEDPSTDRFFIFSDDAKTTKHASSKHTKDSKGHISLTKFRIRSVQSRSSKRLKCKSEEADEKPTKAIIECSSCRHKYRMNLPQKQWKDFLCSRCKMRGDRNKWCGRCQMYVPENSDHFVNHAKSKKKQKKRTVCVPSNKSDTIMNSPQKLGPQITRTSNQDIADSSIVAISNKKYQCVACLKCYVTVDGLLDHINNEHSDDKQFRNCECVVCGKDMKTKPLLDKHMMVHAGELIYECDVCKKVFKSKRWLSIHKKTHKKFKKFTGSF